ncbi:Putative adhesin [Cyclonatronum proteinivorum]|uniref:Adhesin n=2 Tax=Cyclonatronum proteinivorum TaxID=1457365 RepID=A0A345UJ29_9BACT|nr:Putative adhesin [Cyclonatronum proteinivorum]
MKAKCTLLFSVFALLLLPLPAYVHAQPDNTTLTQTFRTGSSPQLSAATSGGNITFETHNRDEVVIHVIARKGRAYLSADELDSYAELIFNESDNQISVEAQRRNSSGFSFFGRSSSANVSISYHILAPSASSTNGRTSGGNISLNGFDGGHQLRTSGGNITLTQTSGTIRAQTSGGNIQITGVSGELDARTSGGRITLNDSNGRLNVRTSGGNINIRDVNGSVEAQTSGGNITASVREPGEILNLRTSGGNVSLNLPATLTAADSPGLELSLRGSSANLQGNLHSVMQNSNVNRNSVSGTFGKGATKVELRTSGGRATLTFE